MEMLTARDYQCGVFLKLTLWGEDAIAERKSFACIAHFANLVLLGVAKSMLHHVRNFYEITVALKVRAVIVLLIRFLHTCKSGSKQSLNHVLSEFQ